MPVTVLAKAVCWLKLAQKESVSTISTFLVQLRYYYWFSYTQFWTQTGGDPTDM